MSIFTREDIIISCIEEVQTIAHIFNCKVEYSLYCKAFAQKGDTIITMSGKYTNLHKIWRSCQNILEYSCQIATYTNAMLNKIKSANLHCELLTTRKTFPFAKEFCIKSVINGGGFIHRLNLSDSILFFQNHRIIYKDDEAFYQNLNEYKQKMPEKKIVVEAKTPQDAVSLLHCGIDVIQVDKFDIATLQNLVALKNQNFKDTRIIAAGGINKENAYDYAKTGIDAIVTSSPYFCGIANLGCHFVTNE